jgi:NAD(P)-dependent dehydrogenase (short-subunit alcohol dehydrogenase family)
MNTFKNQAVIITGAGSGIGEATALLFAREGASVIVSDRNKIGGENTVQQIKNAGGEASFVPTDVSDRKQVEALVNTCVDHYGRLDIMVNNAGIGGDLAFFDRITDEDWQQIIAINQTGVFYCMRAALKVMKTQQKGNIVNVASVAGIGSAPRMGAYAASKHAVVGMTVTAAVEYAKYNIRINAVCPSVIKTPMGDSYTHTDPSITEIAKRAIPMRRFGEAIEVANTISWLCSEGASFITGQAIRVDGGHRS